MKCLICGTANLSPLEDEMDMEIDDVLGVCADCVADAARGRDLLRLPEGYALRHWEVGGMSHEWFIENVDGDAATEIYDHPDKALDELLTRWCKECGVER